MMDLSDGLATDLPRLAAAKKCSFRIDIQAVPKTRGCDSGRATLTAKTMNCSRGVAANDLVPAPQLEKLFPKLNLTAIGELIDPGTPAPVTPRI